MNNTPVDVKTAYESLLKGTLLIDVREPNEFEAGHAQEAVSLPLSELEKRISEIPQDKEVLIICKSGGRSGRACSALEQAGYNVTNVVGGSADWQAQGLPLISENGSTPRVI